MGNLVKRKPLSYSLGLCNTSRRIESAQKCMEKDKKQLLNARKEIVDLKIRDPDSYDRI